MTSLNEKPGPVPKPAPAAANGSAPRSNDRLFSGSERTSYAWETRLNSSSASAPG